jgi:hypothetical protein
VWVLLHAVFRDGGEAQDEQQRQPQRERGAQDDQQFGAGPQATEDETGKGSALQAIPPLLRR